MERSDENKNKIRVSGIRVTRVRVCVYVYVKSFLQTDTEVAREARCKGEERGGE